MASQGGAVLRTARHVLELAKAEFDGAEEAQAQLESAPGIPA